jgi:glycosyltransferase involved in cell wall biosynthesis
VRSAHHTGVGMSSFGLAAASAHKEGPSFANRGQRIGVFVIGFNAESHIQRTLARIPAERWPELDVVYIIDDCSTDETVAKAREVQRQHSQIEVLRNPINRRYGGNQKTGYKYAIDRGLDIVVMLHADGQYAPECLPEILTPLVKGDADLVLGSRMMERGKALAGGMPRYKYVGNIVLTRIQRARSGLQLSEFHSGYRAYRTSFLHSVPLWDNTDEWHFDTQILLQAHRAGVRIVEIPIPTYYGDEICHVNGVVYGFHCIVTTLSYALHRAGVIYRKIFDLGTSKSPYVSKLDDPYSSHTMIWRHLQPQQLGNMRVLDLGVGDATLTRKLHEAGARVDVIEVNPELAEAALPYCHRAIVCDLNRFADKALDERYDIVIAADVLEHLVYPEAVLAELKRYLKKGGQLIVSLPNIANLAARVGLLFGRFNTHRRGLLDATHLHHYTFRTMRLLLRKMGWQIRSSAVTSVPLVSVLPVFRHLPLRVLLPFVHGLSRVFRGLLGYQGVSFCTNPNEPLEL